MQRAMCNDCMTSLTKETSVMLHVCNISFITMMYCMYFEGSYTINIIYKSFKGVNI